MRILHAASNICGLPPLLASEQRRLGHQASALLYPTLSGPAAGTMDLARLLAGNRLTRHTRRARLVAWAARTFDVFHFHFHTTLMPSHADVALLAALHKRIVFHLHGCEIRDPRRARTEHALSVCGECAYPCMVPVKRRLPETLRRYADAVLVSTPDLLEYVEGAEYLPNPVDPVVWAQPRPPAVRTQPPPGGWVVAHAPTDSQIKGTRHVIAAVERLRAEGFPIELRIYEGLPREELWAACAEADVVVDQVLMGWVGLFALEMLALGKPVVAYIRPDLRSRLRGMPVVPADPASLAETLRTLLLAPERRADLGSRGPIYVRERHGLADTCRGLLHVYGRPHAGAARGAPGRAAMAHRPRAAGGARTQHGDRIPDPVLYPMSKRVESTDAAS